jgi:flavin reductase (DIM6/NTAB) family NADH-FMN oxidoreductase RutF
VQSQPAAGRSEPSEALTRAFRDCVGEFATGVTVVTAEHDGLPAGMTLNAFASVSLEPLLVLVSLGHGSRTLRATTASGRFAVSILQREQREVALAFSERGAPFAAGQVERDREGYLTVRGAAAVLRCVVEQVLPAGDHDVVVGEVVSISHGGGEPLVFYRGRFGGMQTDVLVPAGHPIAIDEGAGW